MLTIFVIKKKLIDTNDIKKIISQDYEFYEMMNKNVIFTGCENVVKSLFYTTQFTASQIEYGRENKPVVFRKLEKYLGKKFKPCGLFIDSKDFFLGAISDGLIDNDLIVEMKYPFSTTEEGILTKKNTFWQLQNNGINGDYKKKHNYNFQVQGQLYVTK
jgi:hypothetical protein